VNELFQRRLQLKTNLQKRKSLFAAWTSFHHPSITEIFSRIGIDFIGIDIEHSTISQEQSQRIIAAAQAGGSLCLPRVATHNMEMIKRLLDSGADGIIVPMVSTPQEAQRLISWIKYSPRGKRSFGVARAQGYGFDFAEYTRDWNKTSTFIIQIESVEGVHNIEKILSLDDIDGVMVGPYDLSGSLGIPGELQHQKVKAACRSVIAACRKYKKSCGTQVIEPDDKTINDAFHQGFNFLVLASDVFLLWKWAKRMRDCVNKFKKKFRET